MHESKVSLIYKDNDVKITYEINSSEKPGDELMQDYVNFLRAIGYELDGEEYDFV